MTETPSQTIGPFFHDALVDRQGATVVRADTVPTTRIEVVGTVLDGTGAAVDDALVEIWQPDGSGIFPSPDDPRGAEADPAVKGFGRSDTSHDGAYRFETVKPGVVADAAAGQAPFINVRIFARGLLRAVITRIYFGDEDNERDPVLARVDKERRHTLIAQMEGMTPRIRYRFDVRLQGEDETVFFDPVAPE